MEATSVYREPGKLLIPGYWFHRGAVIKLSEFVSMYRPDNREGKSNPWVIILKYGEPYNLNDEEAASLIDALRNGAG